jgi:hypothetical protein
MVENWKFPTATRRIRYVCATEGMCRTPSQHFTAFSWFYLSFQDLRTCLICRLCLYISIECTIRLVFSEEVVRVIYIHVSLFSLHVSEERVNAGLLMLGVCLFRKKRTRRYKRLYTLSAFVGWILLDSPSRRF